MTEKTEKPIKIPANSSRAADLDPVRVENVLQSKLDVSSPRSRSNASGMLDLVAAIGQQQENIFLGGGEKATASQHGEESADGAGAAGAAAGPGNGAAGAGAICCIWHV